MTEALEFIKSKNIILRGDNLFHSMEFPDEIMDRIKFRFQEYVPQFGLAVPNDEAIKACAAHAPLLEIGAGCVYWAYELRKVGADIIATEPRIGEKNHYTFGVRNPWTKLEELSGVEAVQKYPDRNLIIIWPSYNWPWAYEALQVFTAQIVIYVGEWHGCTADDNFHDLLESNFEEIEGVSIPRFEAIHDTLTIWKRKGSPK